MITVPGTVGPSLSIDDDSWMFKNAMQSQRTWLEIEQRRAQFERERRERQLIREQKSMTSKCNDNSLVRQGRGDELLKEYEKSLYERDVEVQANKKPSLKYAKGREELSKSQLLLLLL